MFWVDSHENSQIMPALDDVLAPVDVTSGVKQPLSCWFPSRLQIAREQTELFRYEVANLAALSDNVVSTYEGGDHFPTVENLEKLACALGIPATWLAYGWEGFEPWRERVARKGETPRPPPVPIPAARPCGERFKTLPDRMKTARAGAAISMRAVSRATGLSPQAIALIEAGRSIPLILNVEYIAKALSVSPGWLAFGEVDEGE